MSFYPTVDPYNNGRNNYGINEDTQNLSLTKTATVTLTAAQLDALAATPITVLAAQGAGKTIIVEQVEAFLDYNTATYAGTNNTIELRYTDDTGAKVITDLPETFVESTADAIYVANGIDVVAVPNAPIVAHAQGDLTTGDSPITLKIFYHVRG